MSEESTADTATARRLQGSPTLTFRGGGWVLLATVLAVGALVLWAMWGVLQGKRPVGDGSTISSYGFVMEPLHADLRYLVASGNPRDFLSTLDDPGALRGDAMLQYNQDQRTVYVATSDRVVGVVLNGEARAYPLAVLNAHEVVNDTLGGVPIAVSYSPLTDSVVVFDRRIDGQARRFKVSGLLYNGNLVMYDTVEAGTSNTIVPSLWSQLGLRAIAGPAAHHNAAIVPLPGVNIASWRMWLAAHPNTSVILPDPNSKKRYKEFSYARYYMSPRSPSDYPVAGTLSSSPEATSPQIALEAARNNVPPSNKAASIVVKAGGETAVWTLAQLLQKTDGKDGIWQTTLGGVPLRIVTQMQPMAAMVQSGNDTPVTVIPQLWFAQQAFAAEAASAPGKQPASAPASAPAPAPAPAGN